MWKESKNLTLKINRIFKHSKNSSLKQELHSISASIPASIAKAFEEADRYQFLVQLTVAENACAELKEKIFAISDNEIMSVEVKQNCLERLEHIDEMITRLKGMHETVDQLTEENNDI